MGLQRTHRLRRGILPRGSVVKQTRPQQGTNKLNLVGAGKEGVMKERLGQHAKHFIGGRNTVPNLRSGTASL
eukprot:13565789-Alexandrium_andersonii.AAC.1